MVLEIPRNKKVIINRFANNNLYKYNIKDRLTEIPSLDNHVKKLTKLKDYLRDKGYKNGTINRFFNLRIEEDYEIPYKALLIFKSYFNSLYKQAQKLGYKDDPRFEPIIHCTEFYN